MSFLPPLSSNELNRTPVVKKQKSRPPNRTSYIKMPTMLPSLISQPTPTPTGAPASPQTERRYTISRDGVRLDAALKNTLKEMDENDTTTLQSSVKAFVKMINGILKKPESTRIRKIRMQNMIIRKFVLDVNGAMSFLQALGFAPSGEGSSAFLLMETVNQPLLRRAVELLNEKLQDLDEEGKAERAREHDRALMEQCYGGCGLLGDARTEGYCMDCYEQLHTGELVFVPHEGNTCYGIALPDLAHASLADLEGAPPGVVLVRSPIVPPSAKPRLCMNGCGRVKVLFMGMCRECWQDRAKDERTPGWKGKWRSARVKLRCMWAFRQAPRLKQKNKKRCWTCRRKVGTLGIDCRCGFIFCGEHRYADAHSCKFDHRQFQKDKLRGQNPALVKKMFDRID